MHIIHGGYFGTGTSGNNFRNDDRGDENWIFSMQANVPTVVLKCARNAIIMLDLAFRDFSFGHALPLFRNRKLRPLSDVFKGDFLSFTFKRF